MSLALTLVVLAQTTAPEHVTFTDAVQRALAHHPAMRVAEQDTARAMAQLEQARAPSLPTLNANGTFTRLDDDRRLGDRLVLGKEQLSANVQLSAPLINTPRWAQWYRASKAVEAMQATSADVKRQVAVNAARAWLSVLGQQRVVRAATTAKDSAQAHLTFATERRQGGVGTRLDELRAAQEFSVSTAQLESALAGLARAQEALGVQTGTDGPLDVVAEEPQLDTGPTLEKSLEAVDVARLDVQAAKVRNETAQAATSLDWMDYLPLLSAVFQPFYQNPPSLTQPLTGWQLNVVLQLPLYDGGLRYGQAHERRANAKSQAAQLEASVRQARSEVRAAFVQVQHADESLKAARDGATQAAEALELANAMWKAGATTSLDVIDAERRARDADLQRALAEDAARQARLDLLVASGAFPR
jgi:outer membrane protein TolC